MTSNQYESAQPPSNAISGLSFSPYTPQRLLVSSWDSSVYLYDAIDGAKQNQYAFDAALLDVCFGQDDDEAFACGLDLNVHRLDLSTGDTAVLSTHSKPVKSVIYDPSTSLLISASWDATLHIHSLSSSRTNTSFTSISLPSKPFALSLSKTKLAVAMANRAFQIYELAALATLPEGEVNHQLWQARESSMKFMTRAVACMPDDSGYASSSIEGRVAVEWFDPSEESQKRKYAFKCHRVTEPDTGADVVYPVNALAFHPTRNVFASGGGDGLVSLWDAMAKRRIKQYQKFGASVAALAFSCDGKYLAIGICPGFEDGKEPEDDMTGLVKVVIRELGPDEAKMKAKK
ncbi:putative nuclear pore complex subunit [Patellaria atrata CBS 101060]|uniref:Nuclear pore complex subunit n=1 Tax=Patellaria atrata CBS 101060 TaxID=1346257 RepID=A0A9P4SC34_9PEZI|nr:putative nuclear pore complex subunit [Patellaria atrata CBS 101060]